MCGFGVGGVTWRSRRLLPRKEAGVQGCWGLGTWLWAEHLEQVAGTLEAPRGDKPAGLAPHRQ